MEPMTWFDLGGGMRVNLLAITWAFDAKAHIELHLLDGTVKIARQNLDELRSKLGYPAQTPAKVA
jgi:hypothetical protein